MEQQLNIAQLIEAVMTDNQRAIRPFYRSWRTQLVPKAQRKFPGRTENEVEEAFHDAILVLFDNYIRKGKVKVEAGKVVGLKGNKAEGLLYFVMKTKLARMSNWYKHYSAVDPDDYLKRFDGSEEEVPETSVTNEWVMLAFEELRPLCQEVLSGKLLHGLNFQELSEELGGSVGSLRVQKNRCLKKLRSLYDKLTTTQSN